MSQAACRKNPMCVTLSDFFGSVFVMNSVRQFPLHALLLLPALLLMLDGLWAGLQRMGWALPHLHPNLAALHGPLMLAGFLGTLIALERAVALRVLWFFGAPLCSAFGTILLLVNQPALGMALITLGSAGLAAMMFVIVRKHSAPYTWLLLAGACMWLIGNVLWFAGFGITNVVLWWSSFLILTIVGERLELSRILRVPRPAQMFFWTALGLFCAGVVIDTLERAFFAGEIFYWGSRAAGLGMLALALWLARYDIARRNLFQKGLTRFIAVCLFSGYIWLGIGGVLRAWEPGATAGFYYDAVQHAVFVGFIIGMIFAHAPIILPAILARPLPYAPVLYAPWLLLQIGLVIRIGGDLTAEFYVRQWGGMLSALAIVFFFATILVLTIFYARSKPRALQKTHPIP